MLFAALHLVAFWADMLVAAQPRSAFRCKASISG